MVKPHEYLAALLPVAGPVAKRNPFRETRLIDVFMCAGFPLMGALVGFAPDLAEARELAPWIAACSILPIGGYLAGYRWV